MMSDSSRSDGTSSTSHARHSSDKAHPSEFLEFASIHPVTTVDIEPAGFKSKLKSVSLGQVETAVNHTQSNDDLYQGLRAAVPGLRRLSVDARNATAAEQKMTLREGFRLYPKAIAWSALLSCTIIMEGYDLTLINSFYAFPVFRRSYGTPLHPDGVPGTRNFQISPAWQAGLTNAAVVGEIVGLLFNGFLTDRFGYHKTMVISLVWMCLAVFLSFFAVNIEMLLVAQIVSGVPWGVFQTLSTTYAAEVMPVALRAYLLSNVNMCWLIGQVCGVGVIRGLVHNDSVWAYRIPFALQWAWALPILIGVLFAPESPWWLIRHEKPEAARKALLRLTRKDAENFNVDETVSMMQHTNEVEKYLNNGGMSYLDCLKGTDLRRTEIACMVWATQALSGSSLTGYAAYFYEQAGFSTANSFNLAVGMYGLAVVGGVISWALLPRLGRRTLYLWGLSVALITLLAAGSVAAGAGSQSTAGSWTLGSLVIFLTFAYDVTIGPVCYVLVAEIPSTRLRVKTVVLARVMYNAVGIITNVITPRMLNPTAWNLKGLSCYVFAATTLLCLVWCWFRLPEPKGLSYLELDILFEKKAKASKFKQFQVNLASTGYFSLRERQGSTWRGY